MMNRRSGTFCKLCLSRRVTALIRLPTVKKQTLKAGATVEFPVAWDLFRSTAGCKQVEGQLGAGTYVATAAYAETSTVRFPFAIKK